MRPIFTIEEKEEDLEERDWPMGEGVGNNMDEVREKVHERKTEGISAQV